MPRDLARRSLEWLLARAGGAALAGRHARGVLVLAYHNVVPDELGPIGDRSLHLPLRDFRAQLDALSKWCDVIPLPDLPKARQSPSARPRVVVTFDDAYQGAVTLGLHELARRGLPATMFVAPGVLDRRTFWWDELAAARADGVVPAAFRDLALTAAQGRYDEVMRLAADRGAESRSDRIPEVARSASVEELRTAVSLPGITLGSHSWSHPNLAALGTEALERELRSSLTWLGERFPDRSLQWIAYPYGLESPAVHAVAAQAGYQGGLRISGGRALPGQGPSLAIPRRNIPAGISVDRFVLAVTGFPRL